MNFKVCAALLGAGLLLAAATVVQAADDWSEGRNYYLVRPAQPTGLPAGKVAVTEVFSYGCPACNKFTMYFITSLLGYTKVHAVVALRECPV